MTTTHQSAWIKALHYRISQFQTDDLIEPYSHEYIESAGLPKSRFSPHGADLKIKAEIMQLIPFAKKPDWDNIKRNSLDAIQASPPDKTRQKQLANKFNKLESQYWQKTRSALTTIQEAQSQHCKPNQQIADPIKLMLKQLLPGWIDKEE